MKNFILNLSIILIISCGPKNSKSTEEVLASGDYTLIQKKKGEIKTQINDLKVELNELDYMLEKMDTDKNLFLVSAIKLKQKKFNHYLNFQGSLDTDQNVVIYPELPGLLKNIYVNQGDKVNKGQLIAKISDNGLTDQLEQLELQRDLAKTTFERLQILWNQKIGSEIQYLQAETNFKSLEKKISQMKDQEDKTRILAPFDGIIDDVIADVGSNLAPGLTPILRIINIEKMKVSAEIPEIHIPYIKKNKKVKIYVPILDKQILGNISSVGNFINPNNRSFSIEIELLNKSNELKPNMTVSLEINDYQNESAILIPSKDILEDEEGSFYVYKLVSDGNDNYKSNKVMIEKGKSYNNMTEIKTGLNEDDLIINDGLRQVEDGQIVKVISTNI
ncbi:MAG: efflux RND transporter periplasmic adaptor subunit [Flavobacteriaceae bacterium]|tara:strand:- start:1110 stop:2279 length:1170 start_codon:yes stop_codon:yes gene_type:complete